MGDVAEIAIGASILIGLIVFLIGLAKMFRWIAKKVDRGERNSQLKRAALYIFVGIFLFIGPFAYLDKTEHSLENTSAQKTTPPPPLKSNDIKLKQEKYKAWKSEYDEKLHVFDSYWNTWRWTFNGITKGTVDKYKAYNDLKGLAADLKSVKEKFSEVETPKELDAADIKNLKEACEYVGKTISARENAVHMAIEMFDNDDYKPSAVEKIKSGIQEGDMFLIKASASLAAAEASLKINIE